MKPFNRIDSRQFRGPSGLPGRFASRFMRKNNHDYYSRVINPWKIDGRERILEVGRRETVATRMIAYPHPDSRIDGWEHLAEHFSRMQRLLEPRERPVLFMSDPGRLNRISFAVDGAFNKCSAGRVHSELARSGFVENSRGTVVRRGDDTYCLCANRR
jgi:hypothetical protein